MCQGKVVCIRRGTEESHLAAWYRVARIGLYYTPPDYGITSSCRVQGSMKKQTDQGQGLCMKIQAMGVETMTST